jgi:hypothetical protein
VEDRSLSPRSKDNCLCVSLRKYHIETTYTKIGLEACGNVTLYNTPRSQSRRNRCFHLRTFSDWDVCKFSLFHTCLGSPITSSQVSPTVASSFCCNLSCRMWQQHFHFMDFKRHTIHSEEMFHGSLFIFPTSYSFSFFQWLTALWFLSLSYLMPLLVLFFLFLLPLHIKSKCLTKKVKYFEITSFLRHLISFYYSHLLSWYCFHFSWSLSLVLSLCFPLHLASLLKHILSLLRFTSSIFSNVHHIQRAPAPEFRTLWSCASSKEFRANLRVHLPISRTRVSIPTNFMLLVPKCGMALCKFIFQQLN